jgi:hypothetical protein
MESVSGAPEHEKYCISILQLECNGMHNMTHRSHRMQNYKLDVTCPDALFVESLPIPPEHEN